MGLAPGSAFGKGGEGSVRLCYAAKKEVLKEAIERINDYLEHWNNA